MIWIQGLFYLVKQSCPDYANLVHALSKVLDGAYPAVFKEMLHVIKCILGMKNLVWNLSQMSKNILSGILFATVTVIMQAIQILIKVSLCEKCAHWFVKYSKEVNHIVKLRSWICCAFWCSEGNHVYLITFWKYEMKGQLSHHRLSPYCWSNVNLKKHRYKKLHWACWHKIQICQLICWRWSYQDYFHQESRQ